MTGRFEPLAAAVQTNCHIADARHAADLSLCTYLLQMREFFRWEHGLPFHATLERDALGRWIAERELRWAILERQAFVALPTPDGDRFHPFDACGVNARLLPHGLVYGAGLANAERPGFFLAQLEERRPLEGGITVTVCGREHARGLFAPPATLQGDAIVLRRESMARWVWEQFEAYGLKRADGPFKTVARLYGLEHDFTAALPRLLAEQGETLILHELGEHRVGRWLEPGWAAMRLALHNRRTELHVRALRDHLADLAVTLPALLQQDAAAGLHFWFAGFDGLRKWLYPSLPAAYAAWCQGDGGAALRHAARQGTAHFRPLAEQVLALHAQYGDQTEPHIHALLTAAGAICPG